MGSVGRHRIPLIRAISHANPPVSYAQIRARRLGLPAPSLNPFARNSRQADNSGYRAPAPAPAGITGWISNAISKLRPNRTAGGAYESTGYASATAGQRRDRRGFGPLDPDEAWDAQVGTEGGYYEEQELGLQDPSHGPYGGGGYGEVGIAGIPENERGRSRSRQRELDTRYDEEVHGGAKTNPFEEAETSNMSLRGVSPRPVVDTDAARGAHKKGQSSLGAPDDSPTERRSMFREDV